MYKANRGCQARQSRSVEHDLSTEQAKKGCNAELTKLQAHHLRPVISEPIDNQIIQDWSAYSNPSITANLTVIFQPINNQYMLNK